MQCNVNWEFIKKANKVKVLYIKSNLCNLILAYKFTTKESSKILLVCITQTKHTLSNIIYGTIVDFSTFTTFNGLQKHTSSLTYAFLSKI